MRQREDGVVLAYSKSDGSCFVLPRYEYARFKQEWMAGRAFWTGTGFYGGEVVIKLGDIVGLNEADPESIAARLADTRADAREDALDG